MIEININNEDLVNIINEVFEEMEVDDIIEEMDGESSDENQPSSDDSGCISDCSEDFTKISEKIVGNSQINALSGRTKHCAIYFYSTGGTYVACASCMIDLRYVRLELISAIQKHVTDYHDAIDGKYCSNCRNPLFTIFLCNMCPICTQFLFILKNDTVVWKETRGIYIIRKLVVSQ